jgi:RNA polymerase sigma-70 factor, ECF subfamily
MPEDDPELESLVRGADGGDEGARRQLLSRYRDRLRRMVAIRLDPRLSARLDPSDVVQEALADAGEKLNDYLRSRPIPFYPWLRRLAGERIVQIHRHHVRSKKRGVGREELAHLPLPDESVWELADRLVAGDSTPSRIAVREESRLVVRQALERLAPTDRDVLVMRYLEQLSFREIAGALGVTEGTAKVRHFRALDRIRPFLGDPPQGGVS